MYKIFKKFRKTISKNNQLKVTYILLQGSTETQYLQKTFFFWVLISEYFPVLYAWLYYLHKCKIIPSPSGYLLTWQPW